MPRNIKLIEASILISFIEKYNLPGLTWHFDKCPLPEVSELPGEIFVERMGEILHGYRCFVTLHNVNDEILIPVNMIDQYEKFEVDGKYIITVSSIFGDLNITNDGKII